MKKYWSFGRLLRYLGWGIIECLRYSLHLSHFIPSFACNKLQFAQVEKHFQKPFYEKRCCRTQTINYFWKTVSYFCAEGKTTDCFLKKTSIIFTWQCSFLYKNLQAACFEKWVAHFWIWKSVLTFTWEFFGMNPSRFERLIKIGARSSLILILEWVFARNRLGDSSSSWFSSR